MGISCFNHDGEPMTRLLLATLPLLSLLVTLSGQEPPISRSPKQALQAVNDLIGTWKGTGIPAGVREDQQKGFWLETISWQWQFKGKDAWLRADFTRSKHFKSAELGFLPDKDQYQLTLQTLAKETQVFTGKLDKRVLTLERQGEGEIQRLVVSMLHANRHLYRLEVKPADKGFFSRRYQVGATKEGVPFASGDGSPECIVSGGLGTIAVVFQGQTYHVCCSGCQDEFLANPEKYIREAKGKKSK